MIFSKEIKEALGIMNRMLDALMTGLSSRGEAGSQFRSAVGDLRANAPDLVESFTIGTELYNVFEQARASSACFSNLDAVRVQMLSEQPVYNFGTAMKDAGIVFSFVEQCMMIGGMTFVSRFDVEQIMAKMEDVIEDIKLEVAELLDGFLYLQVVELAAALIQHLAATERQLPRIVAVTTPMSYPSLRLATYFYNDGARADEIADENKVIHPAFCPMSLRVLSR